MPSCGQIASERTCRDAWTVLRAALGNAVREEILPRNVAALMQILRHSQIAVTMDIYSEVPSAATRKALRKLGDQLG